MESGHHGLEYQKNGGHGRINDQGRLRSHRIVERKDHPTPLSVPFNFHGRYDSYIQLKSDRLLGQPLVQTVSLGQQCNILSRVLARKTGSTDPLARLE